MRAIVSVDHYENFPVASWLCPAPIRPAVQAIYRFARTADDIADEGTASADTRKADLHRYRQALHRCFADQDASDDWPSVFTPLAAARASHALPRQPFDDLLSAFLQDADNPLHDDRGSLLAYCTLSANPVGRLMLHLYGINDAAALRQSDAICSALQLINFWQDLSRDLPRGRVYLPVAELRATGLAPSALQRDDCAAALAPLVRDLCTWATRLMCEGAPLVHQVPGRAGWELRLVVQGGLRILEKIAAMNYMTRLQRPTLSRSDAPRLLWRALIDATPKAPA